ncbi:MAG TPA: hypothetical protein VF278_08720 [Pirellulales bacterium]
MRSLLLPLIVFGAFLCFSTPAKAQWGWGYPSYSYGYTPGWGSGSYSYSPWGYSGSSSGYSFGYGGFNAYRSYGESTPLYSTGYRANLGYPSGFHGTSYWRSPLYGGYANRW